MEPYFGAVSGKYNWVLPNSNRYSAGTRGFIKGLFHPEKIMLKFLKDNGFIEDYKLHDIKVPKGGVKRKNYGLENIPGWRYPRTCGCFQR